MAQRLKCLPAMQETGVSNPWVGKIPWRRKWQSSSVFLPGKSRRQRSLVGYSPLGRKESDTTERLHFHFSEKNAQNSPSQASQYVNRELPDVQAGFRKGRGTRDQIANIRWITEKAREFQKNIYFCFTDYTKAFDCVQFSSVQSLSRV